jgi:hypothetical protein
MMKKSRERRWARHVARIIIAYKLSAGIPEENKSLARPKHIYA